MDAGGESYAQPDPFLTSLAADAVTNLFQVRARVRVRVGVGVRVRVTVTVS